MLRVFGRFDMSVKVSPTGYSFSFAPMPSIDPEEKEIMDRLLAYGCTPTGDKTTDRAKLRRIEEEKAKQDNYVSNKYLTVSQAECQRIQDSKKEKRKINNPELSPQVQDKRQGAKFLGEQVFLAIKMKNNIKESEKDTPLKKVS
ncbi:MAG: hypothetical protein K6E29_09680 [Cyanobacteria bacterium RUI128]|nr:hypothetical protein [Cyanobacteria bacterium RUI128]